MESHNLAQNAIWITGATGAIILMIRQAVLSYFSAKNQVVAANAQDNVIERLESEIARLERTINKQIEDFANERKLLISRIESLESRIDNLAEKEKQDIADLTELGMLFEISCEACPATQASNKRILEIIELLKSRKL